MPPQERPVHWQYRRSNRTVNRDFGIAPMHSSRSFPAGPSSIRNYLQVALRLDLALGWHDLVRVDTHHHVGNVIRNLSEQMTRPRGDDYNVARLEVVDLGIYCCIGIPAGA